MAARSRGVGAERSLGPAQGALTCPAPHGEVLGAVRCWVRCTGRRRNPPCAEPHRVLAWPIPAAGFWVTHCGWGCAGVSPRGAGSFRGTSWGRKALSPVYALREFDLPALKASHFPWGMRMLSWVGSSHRCPSLCHPPREGADPNEGLYGGTSSPRAGPLGTGRVRHARQHKELIVPRWK